MATASDLSALLRQALLGADATARLAAICELRDELDHLEIEGVADALRTGLSWREIGGALGISKQAAHRRHAKGVGELGRAAATTDSGREAVVSAEVRHAVRVARREAAAAGLTAIGTEHLLLGLLQCGDGPTSALLARLGVTPAAARSAVESTIEIPLDAARRAVAVRDGAEEAPQAPLSALTRRVVALALKETVERGARTLTALDLLDAVLRHDNGGAAQTLVALGVSPLEVRRQILSTGDVTGPVPSAPPHPAATGAGQG